MRRSLLLLLSVILFCSSAWAQRFSFGVPNLVDYDKRYFHYGFSLGLDIVDVNIKTKTNYQDPNICQDFNGLVLKEIKSSAKTAFNVGILVNLRLGDYFDLRFIPAFSWAHDFHLTYIFFQDNVKEELNKDINCNYINLPLFFKFKSSRMHNVRVYVMSGAQLGINMSSMKNYLPPENKKTGYDDISDLRVKEIVPLIKRTDFQVKGGFGFDFYTTYFKLSAEFNISFGLFNMLEKPENIKDDTYRKSYLTLPIVTGIQSLKSKTISLSIIFE